MQEEEIRRRAKELIDKGNEIRNWMSFYYLDPPKFRPGQFRAWARHRWWREFNDPIWEGWYRYSLACFGGPLVVLTALILVVAWIDGA